MSFPANRMRRSRQAVWSRAAVREQVLSVSDLIWPLFVKDGPSEEVVGFTGGKRRSIDDVVRAVERACELGIPMVALFPVVPDGKKSENAEEALREDNLICRCVQEIKKRNLPIGIMVDVALDPYTSHGHDGLISMNKVDNDMSLTILVEQARLLAAAGADVIAPSDMMDGRVGKIRSMLEDGGYHDVLILSYAAKYASSLYGPFRDAVGSRQSLGVSEKKSYQMDYANAREALLEVELDLNEGADWVMVKPAMMYLDVIYQISDSFQRPTFAYQVSGEYVMLESLAQSAGQDMNQIFYESLVSCKRAGATGILTYAACEVAEDIERLVSD